MPLRADNGTLLDIKEPIVLDSEGNAIAVPSESPHRGYSRTASGVRVFKLNGWYAPLALLAVGAVVVLGTFFLGALLIGFLVFGLVRFLIRSFKL